MPPLALEIYQTFLMFPGLIHYSIIPATCVLEHSNYTDSDIQTAIQFLVDNKLVSEVGSGLYRAHGATEIANNDKTNA